MKKLLICIFSVLLSSTAIVDEKAQAETSVAPAPIFTHSKPAVDGLNGELWVYGGAGMANAISTTPITGLSTAREESGSNFQGITGVTGVITSPIGHDFGFQHDLGAGTFERG
jgi:hypothetical protein